MCPDPAHPGRHVAAAGDLRESIIEQAHAHTQHADTLQLQTVK